MPPSKRALIQAETISIALAKETKSADNFKNSP
jgi:hypothetical protein